MIAYEVNRTGKRYETVKVGESSSIAAQEAIRTLGDALRWFLPVLCFQNIYTVNLNVNVNVAVICIAANRF